MEDIPQVGNTFSDSFFAIVGTAALQQGKASTHLESTRSNRTDRNPCEGAVERSLAAGVPRVQGEESEAFGDKNSFSGIVNQPVQHCCRLSAQF